MTFLLKKLVSFWLMPLPLCLVLLTVGGMLLWTRRGERAGKWLVSAGAALLLFFSHSTASKWLLRPLESVYPPIPELVAGEPLPARLAECRAVVVLGGGHSDLPMSAVNRLSQSAQARLAEAVRLLHAMPADVQLVVSGAGAPGFPSHAAVLARAATTLGVEPHRIVQLQTPRDTEDEAAALRQLLGDRPFALVTSAWHLPRAVALMRGAGLEPLPCPADYLAKQNPRVDWRDFLWDVESLNRSTAAVRERLGYAWVRLRGVAR